MALTKEELLSPRNVAIAPYPCSPYDVGDLIEYSTSGKTFKATIVCKGQDDEMTIFIPVKCLASMNAIFKKLNWWDERSIWDMPEYLFDEAAHEYVKLEQFNPDGFISSDVKTYSPTRKTTHWNTLFDCLPATEEEYNTYLSSKNR